MTYLFIYLAIVVVGYLIGSRLRKKNIRPKWISKVMTAVIIFLIFIMGSRIGSNEQIIESLDTIGLVAFAYTAIIIVFTCAGFYIARRLMGFDRYGIRHRAEGAGGQAEATGGQHPGEATSSGESEATPAEKESPINSFTLIIVAFVVLGILTGHFILPESFMVHTGNLLTLSLCMLLIVIGIDIGIEGTIVQNFKNAGWRIIAFPFVSIISMVAGSLLAAAVLPISIQDSLCIGSGLGWYSLAPAMLAEYSARISAISFMHNVLREILGLLLVPIIANKVGYIECYSAAGCTSMDVCLPVVERCTGADIAVYSFICGATLSASVPILVSIFMNL